MPTAKAKPPGPPQDKLDQAAQEGRLEAISAYPSALLPIKYHEAKELADAWETAFMAEYSKRRSAPPPQPKECRQ